VKQTDLYILVSGQEYIASSEQPKKIEKIIRTVISSANLPLQTVVSVALTDDENIRELNKKWRQKDQATDILSFSAAAGEEMPGLEKHLGEMIISLETARVQAKQLGHSLVEEVGVLVAHGLMHLLGLDHERSGWDATMQAECEMAVLDCAGIDPSLCLSARFGVN